MASQSLYRKWRSQTFDDLVGQGPIIDTLKNALTTNTLRHAYLFTGPRGTGKTSTARLLAKTVNCLNSHNGEPCNTCQQCRDITAGNSFNVIEIDAASNRGIDSIRELREKVLVPPATGKYKIYILDEAHMLTTEAFNALLKTLEEPPDYVIFVMATTDVHKMLPTVISRCQRLDFKRISTRQIVTHLLFVAKEEQVTLEQSAAELIARSAAGGMRDALSLLDQTIAYSGDAITLAHVQSMLGVADPRAISDLIRSIAAQDNPTLLHTIHKLSEAGADLRQINVQMVEYWRGLMLAKAGADVVAILDLTEDESKDLQELVPAFTLEELIDCSRIFAQNDLIQKSQGAPQLGLELAALECAELHRRVVAGPPATRQQVPTQIQPSRQTPAPEKTAPVTPPVVQPEKSSDTPPASARRNEAWETPPASAERSLPAPHTAPVRPIQEKAQPSLTVQQVIESWENVRKRAKQKSGLLAAYLQHWQVIAVEASPEGPLVLITAINQRQFEKIKSNDRSKDIEWALSMEFNQTCKVRLVPPGQTATPPVHNLIAYSNETIAVQPVAHVEPPATRTQTVPLTPSGTSEPSLSSTTPVASTPKAAISSEIQSPVARQQPAKKAAFSREEAQQKVQKDPVVQEVIRAFQATIGDILPKE